MVERLAHLEAAVAVGRDQLARVDVVLALFTRGRLGDALAHDGAQPLQGLAADDMDMPGLQVAPGGGARGGVEHAADGVGRNGPGQEAADGLAAGDGLADFHANSGKVDRRARFR
ncbi:hypothetical protein D9M72_558490 [compost metagenome]